MAPETSSASRNGDGGAAKRAGELAMCGASVQAGRYRSGKSWAFEVVGKGEGLEGKSPPAVKATVARYAAGIGEAPKRTVSMKAKERAGNQAVRRAFSPGTMGRYESTG